MPTSGRTHGLETGQSIFLRAGAKLYPEAKRVPQGVQVGIVAGKAARQLLIEQLGAHLFQGRARGKHLGDNVRAAPLVLDHALQAAYLALDPLEPVEQLLVGS
jgi:hypothetical protein